MQIPENIRALQTELEAIPSDTEAAERAKLEKDIYYQMAKAWDEEKNLDKTLEVLNLAAEKLNEYEASPEEAALVYYNLGGVQYDLRQLEDAKVSYEQIIKLPTNKHQADGFYRLAICLYQLGAPKAASDTLEKGLELEEISLAQSIKIHNLAVVIYSERKENASALQHLEQALETLQSSETDNHALGETFVNLRAFVKGAMTPSNQKVYYERLLEQYEEHPNFTAFVQYNLGVWHQQNQKTKPAQAAYEQALTLKLQENITYELGDTYYWLAGIYQDQKRQEEATDYYLKALAAMQAQQEIQHATMTVYALEHILEALPEDNPQRNEIKTAIEEAKANGIDIEKMHYDEVSPEEESINEEDISFQALIDQDPEELFREVQSQAKTNPKEFIQASQNYLKHLEQRYQKAWLGKKKKKQVYESQKAEILAEVQKLQKEESLADYQSELAEFAQGLQNP